MWHRQFVALVLFLASAHALADLVDPGAAYVCDRAHLVFSIASVMETNSPEDQGTVLAPPSFINLSASRSVQCTIGGAKVSAKFSVRPLQASGTCGGIRQISLMSLWVNWTAIFDDPVPLNHYCLEEQVLHAIDIKPEGSGAHIRICRAGWEWGVG